MELVEIHIAAPEAEVADRIARRLVEARLAACVQVLPGVTSTYRWAGSVEQSGEVLLLVKTTAELFEDVSAAVCELHPYDVPEILAVPVSAVLPAYADWVEASVSG